MSMLRGQYGRTLPTRSGRVAYFRVVEAIVGSVVVWMAVQYDHRVEFGMLMLRGACSYARFPAVITIRSLYPVVYGRGSSCKAN